MTVPVLKLGLFLTAGSFLSRAKVFFFTGSPPKSLFYRLGLFFRRLGLFSRRFPAPTPRLVKRKKKGNTRPQTADPRPQTQTADPRPQTQKGMKKKKKETHDPPQTQNPDPRPRRQIPDPRPQTPDPHPKLQTPDRRPQTEGRQKGMKRKKKGNT